MRISHAASSDGTTGVSPVVPQASHFLSPPTMKIGNIVERHGGVTKALDDYEGQMAILMGISQIGETLKKIDDDIVIKYDLQEDKDGAYYTRNYIVVPEKPTPKQSNQTPQALCYPNLYNAKHNSVYLLRSFGPTCISIETNV